MERVKEKLSSLRLEADEAQGKAEELKARVKVLDQENLSKEQEITSLSHKNQLLEAEVEKLEASVKHWKDLAEDNGKHTTQNETLQRRLQLLEEEAEEADKNLRETNDKLRQTDVKADLYQRKVQALEGARDQWEAKYEEMSKKYADVQKQMEELISDIGNV